MQIIKPREITGKILTLVEEAEDHLVIVSPYLNISKWSKVTDAIERARERGVSITFYLREDQRDHVSQVVRFAPSIRLVDRLHAKLYLNEKAAVFTSFNLVLASDEKSTDLGIYTEDRSLLDEFQSFVTKYLDTVSEVLNDGRPLPKNTTENNWINTDERSHEAAGALLSTLVPWAAWRDGNTYWFSSKALPPGDVMVGRGFVWKLRRDDNNVVVSVKWIQELAKECPSALVDFQVDDDHPKYIYIRVIPKEGYKPSDFLADFFGKLRIIDSPG